MVDGVVKSGEIWAIASLSPNVGLLVPMDDDYYGEEEACNSFMAFPTRADAEICLKSQIKKEYIEEGAWEVKRIA
jgi:hypothetical protein